jgi:5-hydroxyisourate hydrolase
MIYVSTNTVYIMSCEVINNNRSQLSTIDLILSATRHLRNNIVSIQHFGGHLRHNLAIEPPPRHNTIVYPQRHSCRYRSILSLLNSFLETLLQSMPTPPNTAPNRLTQLATHLQQPATAIPTLQPSTPPTMAERPFITCHVLDTVTGRPAPSIPVKLKLLSPTQATTAHWTANTNTDGRVTAWESSTDLNSLVEKIKSELKMGDDGEEEDQMLWSLTFDTESYFGRGKTFWPEVELRFAAKGTEAHYHVPLLLGPWSYTTYRGS